MIEAEITAKQHAENYHILHNAGFDEIFIRVRQYAGFEVVRTVKGTLFAIKNIRFDKSDNPDTVAVTADMAGDLEEAQKYLKERIDFIILNLEKNGKCTLEDIDDKGEKEE